MSFWEKVLELEQKQAACDSDMDLYLERLGMGGNFCSTSRDQYLKWIQILKIDFFNKAPREPENQNQKTLSPLSINITPKLL